MTEKPSVTLPGTVENIIKPSEPSQPEKAQIAIEGADDLYKEIRIKNSLTTENGNEVPKWMLPWKRIRKRPSRRGSKTTCSVQRFFPRRPRLPPPVHPQPLLRVLPHVLFNDRRKFLCVGLDVRLQIPRAQQLHRRIKPQPVLA
jgi:hypothetical protein